jgi:uncharacterized phage-associated protein
MPRKKKSLSCDASLTAIEIAAVFKHQYRRTKLPTMKLLYYAQAHHLLLFGTPLFKEEILAWENGPVVSEARNCWERLQQPCLLHPRIERLLSCISKWYPQTGSELIELTHSEAPWKDTPRNGVISHQQLLQYFMTAKFADDRVAEYWGVLLGHDHLTLQKHKECALQRNISFTEYMRRKYLKHYSPEPPGSSSTAASQICEFYDKSTQEAVQWNEKWFAILDSRRVTKEQLVELGFSELVIPHLLAHLPTREEWEQQDKDHFEC